MLAHVDVIDQDLTALHIVEAHHERDDGGFAGAGVADDGSGLVWLDGEGDAFEDPLNFRRQDIQFFWRCPDRNDCLLGFGELLVREPDVAELDAAGDCSGNSIRFYFHGCRRDRSRARCRSA